MTEVNFNTKTARQKGKHLSKEERETINALLNQGYSYRKMLILSVFLLKQL